MTRRSTDGEDEDHAGQRRWRSESPNGHTRWVVGAVSVGLLSLLALFASRELARLDQTVIQSNANSLAISTMNTRFDDVVRRLDEIKAEVNKKK